MHVLEIYRKLPRTNCRDCGESACMAFALKVQTGQRKLMDCPHLEGAGGTPAEAQTDTVSDAYEQTSHRLQAQLQETDFGQAAAALGAQYSVSADVIRLALLNRPIEVRRDGLYEEGTYSRDSWCKLIVYDYVLRRGSTPPAGEWVALQHFPKTPSHVKAFQTRAEAELARVFGLDPNGLRRRLGELGAVDMPGEAKADLACRLDLLPRVPLYLQFWSADDEFPASCKFAVDRSATDYLDIEYVARLVAKCVERVVGRAV